MSRSTMLLLALAAGPAAFGAESAATEPKAALALTLAQAYKRALEANPGLGRARAEVDVAQAQKAIFKSAILPRLGATGSLIRNTKEVSFGSSTDSRVILPMNDWNYRITLTQPLFAGLRESRAYTQSKIGVEMAGDTLHSTRDQILLKVAGDYLEVVQEDALVEVERKNLALSEDRRRQAKAFFEAGEVTRVDVLRAQSAVKQAERRVAGAEQLRDNALGHLRLDLAVDVPIAASETDPALPALPDEATLLTSARATRPDVARAEKDLRVAELEVAKQRGAYLPVLTVDAGYINQKTTFPADRYGYAALRVTVPIYQGGEIGARVALAKSRERQARLALEDARRSATEDVRRALLDLHTAETNLALAEEQLAAAEADHAQTFELYRAREATTLDTEAAEASLADARRAVVIGHLTLSLSKLQVLAAAGLIRNVIPPENPS